MMIDQRHQSRLLKQHPLPYPAAREIAKANIDITKAYTNTFVEQAKTTTGMNAK
jgi:hypothetical protein